MRFRNLGYLCLAAGLAFAPSAFADTATYANITAGTVSQTTGSATGTIGSVGFTYSGETDFVNLSNTGATNYFASEPGTYTSATVSNAPTDGALIALTGNGTTTNTITFSTPVTGLILSEVSLGGGTHTSYTFNDPFVVLSCGPNAVYGGGCFDQGVGTTSSVLSGQEVDGTIEFQGTIGSLSFTTANGEYWNGFDLGLLPQDSVAATPEPSSLMLLGTGLLAGAGAARRRFIRR